MITWVRMFSRIALCTTIVSANAHAMRVGSLNIPYKPRPKVTLAVANAAQNPLINNTINAAKFGRNSKELSQKALRATRSGLSTMGGETAANVFQSYVIVVALAIAELTKLRMERDRLLDGQNINFDQVTAAVTASTDDVMCASGNSAKGPTAIINEMSCSGEFWFSTFAGTSGVLAAQFLLNFGTQFLFKGAGGLLRKMIVGIVSSFLMLAGFQVSGYVWTQAVNFLDDDNASFEGAMTRNQKLNQAHGILPRAIHQMISGKWNTYVETADGRVAQEVFQNMYNMILLDDKMRATFMDNVWRFGLMRGQFVENLILMTAILPASAAVASGTVAGITATAGALGVSAVGTTAFSGGTNVIAAIVATIFCAAVISAAVFLPDTGFAQAFDNAVQDIRSWSAGSAHANRRHGLEWNSMGFKTPPEQMAEYLKSEYEYIRNDFVRDLDDLPRARAEWVKVAIEKYQELRLRVEEAEHMILVMDEVLKNSKLRDQILIGGKGQQMTYEQARRKHCYRKGARGPIPSCDFPLALQLQKLEESKRTVAEGRRVLESLSFQIVDVYYKDYLATQKLMDQSDLNFSLDVAFKLAEVNDHAATLVTPLAYYFGSFHESVRNAWTDIYFVSQEEQQITQANANDFIARAYINGMNEADLLERISRAQALY